MDPKPEGLLKDEELGCEGSGNIPPSSLGSESNTSVGSSTVRGDSTRDEGGDFSEVGLLCDRAREDARSEAASLGGEDSLLSRTSIPWSSTGEELSGKSGGGSNGRGGGEDSGRGGRSPSSSESNTTRSVVSVRALSTSSSSISRRS